MPPLPRPRVWLEKLQGMHEERASGTHILIIKMISKMISSALLSQSPRQLYFPLGEVAAERRAGTTFTNGVFQSSRKMLECPPQ